MHDFKNTFRNLHTNLGIKDFKCHLVLKYHDFMHKYIQE